MADVKEDIVNKVMEDFRKEAASAAETDWEWEYALIEFAYRKGYEQAIENYAKNHEYA